VESLQLLHEPAVGGDAVALVLHMLETPLQRPPILLHNIGNDCRGGPANAFLAVDQHVTLLVSAISLELVSISITVLLRLADEVVSALNYVC